MTEPMLLEALADRDARPLLLIDLAVPRDVAPTARDIDDVTLLDVRDVSRFAGERFAPPARAIAAAEDVIADGRRRVPRRGHRSQGRAPRHRAAVEEPRTPASPSSHARRALVASLSDEQRDALESLTRALVAKVLHEPTVRLKDAAGSEAGERLASSVRHLFDLDDR